MKNGFFSKLKVTLPPVTIPSWPCLFSGMTPYQLGYNYFFHPKKGLFNSYIWRDKSIFSNPGLKSFVLNVPGTYPAWKINGEMISGMLSPSFSSYPKNLELTDKKNWIIDGRNISNIFDAFEKKKSVFLSKLNQDFNLMVFVIRMPDAISHHANMNLKKVINYIYLSFKKIDFFIQELLKVKDIDNIFILSDHGLKIYENVFYLNTWLKRKKIFERNYIDKIKILESVFLKLYDIIRLVVRPNFYFIKIFNKILRKRDNVQEGKTSVSEIDLNPFIIQNYASNVGGLYLNKEKKNLKKFIKTELGNNKCVKEIIFPEFKFFPDLYIILKNNYLFNDEPSFFKKRRTNAIDHSQTGLFIAYGKNIENTRNDIINYYDIAPTILKLFKIEKKSFMIGEPLKILRNL